MTPWSRGWHLAVVLLGKNVKLTAINFGWPLWAAQLSRISITHCFSATMSSSNLRSQLADISCIIHTFLFALYVICKHYCFLKQCGLADLPMTNRRACLYHPYLCRRTLWCAPLKPRGKSKVCLSERECNLAADYKVCQLLRHYKCLCSYILTAVYPNLS